MFRSRILIGLLSTFAVATVGCTDNGPVSAVPNQNNERPEFIKLPKRLGKSLSKIVSTTSFIEAATGGTIELSDTYRAAPDSHLVTLFIKLKLEPNALPYDASLTLSVDDVEFISTVAMTFGPHGIVFNKPAKLTVEATGLDLGPERLVLKLYYINSSTGLWERMPASNAVYQAGAIDAHGKLPHFSQYAFGRNQ